MKTFYIALKAKLTTALPQIAHCSKWNNQIQNIEDEIPFNRPALFIEIESVSWDKYSKTSKTGIVTLVLHVISDCYDTHADDADAMDALDLTDEVTQIMETTKLSNCTPFININTFLDNDHGNLIAHSIMFNTEYTKCVGDSKNYQEVTPQLAIINEINP